MKYNILRHFRTSTPLKEKSSDHFKDLRKMELLTNPIITLFFFSPIIMKFGTGIKLDVLYTMVTKYL